MSDTFQDFITRERQRLHADREALFSQQHEIAQKLLAIDNEMRAIDAYEAAKAAPARGGGRRTPSRRGSRRDGILQAIKGSAAGLTRGEILEKMGLKGNKSGEMSVSNALTALTKGNQVARHDGKYVSV